MDRRRRFGTWSDHPTTDTPRLTREQEVDLAAKARAGDREARDTMVLSCYPMVLRACSRMKCNAADRGDMAQAAVFGLLRAVDLYDPGTGNRLSTWCWRGIMFAAGNWRHRQYGRTHRVPVESCDYLDEIARDDDEPACEAEEEHQVTRRLVCDAMSDLPPRWRDVLHRRVMADETETLAELGELYGLSKERIRQIEGSAKRQVRRRILDAMVRAKPGNPGAPL